MALLSLLFGFTFTSVNSWNYKNEGPSYWPEIFSACGGEYQSPINIDSTIPEECYNQTKLSLNWDYTESETDYIVTNNGHTIVLTPVKLENVRGINTVNVLNTNKNKIAKLRNIWFDTYESEHNEEYCLDSLHFHWGQDGSVGSEHTFDGKYSAFEAHFLHYSCDYSSLGEALKAYNSGKSEDEYVLSAIGILFDVGAPNPAIENIVKDNIINNVYKIGGIEKDLDYKKTNIYTSFKIDDFLPTNKEFVSYYGSITAPPCNETVRWNVLTEKLTISNTQLNQLRKLLESENINDKLINNYRPTLINENEVFYCKSQVEKLNIVPDKDAHILAIIIIAGSVIFFFICLIGVCKYNKRRKSQKFADLNSLSTAGETEEVSMKKLVTDNTQYACYT